jgi:plasmid stabilization system protein ParE
MSDIRLTKAAAQDIEGIEQYSVAEFGVSLTADYLSGLSEALARLRDYPGAGVMRGDLWPGTRSLRYRSHRIYYRAASGEIVIQRVLHYARMVRREMIDDR